MKNKGIFLSFVGCRGSGKTTVSNIVFQKLTENNKNCIRQHPGFSRKPMLRGIWTAFSLLRFFNPSFMLHFGFYGRKKAFVPSLYKIFLPLAFLHDLYELKKYTNGVLIYDSNILRGIISAFGRNKISSEKVQKIYRNEVLSKVNKVFLVFVDTNPVEAVNRWVSRDKIALSAEGYKQAIYDREKFKKEALSLLEVLYKIDGVELVYVNGGTSAEKNAEIICNKLIN